MRKDDLYNNETVNTLVRGITYLRHGKFSIHCRNDRAFDLYYGKNDFAERFKILLDENNFVGTLKIMNNATKSIDILAISLSVLHNYFDNPTKLIKFSVSS